MLARGDLTGREFFFSGGLGSGVLGLRFGCRVELGPRRLGLPQAFRICRKRKDILPL